MAKTWLDALPEVFVSNTASSSAVSRAAANGLLRRIGSKLYTKNLIDPPEQIVRRHLWQLIAGEKWTPMRLAGASVKERVSGPGNEWVSSTATQYCQERA